MLFKTCMICKKKLKLNEKCKKCYANYNKEYDKKYRNKKASKFYQSKAWKLIRNKIMERFNYIDMYELKTSGKIIQAEIVHHIVPLEESSKLSLCDNNLIPLSTSNHNKIHKIYNKNINEKTKLQLFLKSLVKTGGVKKVCK